MIPLNATMPLVFQINLEFAREFKTETNYVHMIIPIYRSGARQPPSPILLWAFSDLFPLLGIIYELLSSE